MAQLKQLMVLHPCLSCLAWDPNLCQWHSLAKAQSFAACCKDSCSHPESYKITSVVCASSYSCCALSSQECPYFATFIKAQRFQYCLAKLLLSSWRSIPKRGNFQRSCQYYDSGSDPKKRKRYNLLPLVPVPMEVFPFCHSLFFWVIETKGFQSRGL